MAKQAKNELSNTFSDDKLDEIIKLIAKTRQKVYSYANSELIGLYWMIGQTISETLPKAARGKELIKKLSDYILTKYQGIDGFSPSNIARMRRFYDTYKDSNVLATLLPKLSCSHNLRILSCKTEDERRYYIETAIKNNYSFRELDRQIERQDYYSRLSSKQSNQQIISKYSQLEVFRDNYTLEFLALTDGYKEADLKKAILNNLKKFILEFGKDFTLLGDQYSVQVGNSDFKIDLLFFNRSLKCLVAVELKSGKFKPSYLGQLNFYLEALDRDVKKDDENPSVGIILCSEKDDIVVEYAMASNLKPSLVSQYQLYLPSKQLLEERAKIVSKNEEFDE